MKKENKILIIEFAIALFIVICLTSCGARKVQKSETKEQEQKSEKITLETETSVTDNTRILDTSTTDEIEICPVSDTLPMVINGITYKNARLRHIKKKNNISINKNLKVSQKAKKQSKKYNYKNKLVIEKEVKRESNYFWLFWLLILIPIYFAYKKYKDKIWFI